jgi:prepilin-type N-terminal cleavage/methylation domain-containing protein
MSQSELSPMKKSLNSPPGFSLTECLVVMAILLILAALTFPALSHLRARGDSVETLNQVRTVGLAIQMYALISKDLGRKPVYPDSLEKLVENNCLTKADLSGNFTYHMPPDSPKDDFVVLTSPAGRGWLLCGRFQ